MSAAGDEDDAPGLQELVLILHHAGKDDLAGGGNDAAADAVAQRFRLLVDLLQHEMVVSALFQLGDGQLQLLDGNLAVLPLQVHDVQRLPLLDDGDFVVVQVHEILGVVDDGRGVGRQEILAVADADGHRAALPGHDDAGGVPLFEDRDGVGADHLLERGADGHLQRALLGFLHVFDQIDQHLGVSAAAERETVRAQGVAEHPEVLDDPVVDQGEVPRPGEVRVRIGVVGLAMGGPAGMADADRAGTVFPVQERFQVRYLALAFVDVQAAARVDHRHAGAVIAPVLQPMESLDDDRARLPLTNITYDSAHNTTV